MCCTTQPKAHSKETLARLDNTRKHSARECVQGDDILSLRFVQNAFPQTLKHDKCLKRSTEQAEHYSHRNTQTPGRDSQWRIKSSEHTALGKVTGHVLKKKPFELILVSKPQYFLCHHSALCRLRSGKCDHCLKENTGIFPPGPQTRIWDWRRNMYSKLSTKFQDRHKNCSVKTMI